jgi:type VI protein secretion system component VasK
MQLRFHQAALFCSKSDPNCHSNTQDIVLLLLIGGAIFVAAAWSVWSWWRSRRRAGNFNSQEDGPERPRELTDEAKP